MTDFTPEHHAILEAAIDLAETQHGIDLGMPTEGTKINAFRKLMNACADLAAENDGTLPLPDESLLVDTNQVIPTTQARGTQQPNEEFLGNDFYETLIG